jgi:hypothetical protein
MSLDGIGDVDVKGIYLSVTFRHAHPYNIVYEDRYFGSSIKRETHWFSPSGHPFHTMSQIDTGP